MIIKIKTFFVLAIFLINLPLFSLDDEMLTRPKVALVLEGGGALGIAHIGIIKALEEVGIPIDIVVGTSMGAIIGGLYSIGYTADELENIISKANWTDLFFGKSNHRRDPIWQRIDESRHFTSFNFSENGLDIDPGLVSDSRILTFFDSLTASIPTPVDFDSFPRKFRAVATDVSNGSEVILKSGSLSNSLRASMSIPGVFAPYEIDNKFLVDGGLINNLPINVAREMGADIVIAVNLIGGVAFNEEEHQTSLLSSLSSSMDIILNQNVNPQLDKADLVIDVNLWGYHIGDFLESDKILGIGSVVGESYKDQLEVLKSDYNIPITPNSVYISKKPIKRVIVDGAKTKDAIKLVESFKELNDFIPNQDITADIIEKISKVSSYDDIRLTRIAGVNGSDYLGIKVTKKSNDQNTISFGYQSNSTYGSSMNSQDAIYTGFTFNNLFSKSSIFTILIDLNAQPGIDLSYIQPFGLKSYIRGSIAVSTEIDTYEYGDLENISYQYRKSSSLIEWGVVPINSLDYSLGFRLDNLTLEHSNDKILSGEALKFVPMLYLSHHALTLDYFILPQNGLYFNSDLLYGIPELFGSRAFMTLNLSLGIAKEFGRNISIGIDSRYGSDFSVNGDDEFSAPLSYKPDVYTRDYFPGYMKIEERIGSHIFGFNFLAKYRSDVLEDRFNLPVFILLQCATAHVFQSIEQFDSPLKYQYWSGGLGLGIRFDNAFGFRLRGGVNSGFDRKLDGYISLDLGAFGIQ